MGHCKTDHVGEQAQSEELYSCSRYVPWVDLGLTDDWDSARSGGEVGVTLSPRRVVVEESGAHEQVLILVEVSARSVVAAGHVREARLALAGMLGVLEWAGRDAAGSGVLVGSSCAAEGVARSPGSIVVVGSRVPAVAYGLTAEQPEQPYSPDVSSRLDLFQAHHASHRSRRNLLLVIACIGRLLWCESP